ncbi:MAG: galactose mutarotase [Bacteroidales bacterium]|nr:galactose mutarotase [Bacteroidales bacterium]
MHIQKKNHQTPNRIMIQTHILRNDNGMEAHITNFGGRIQRLLIPTREGNKLDVVLGFDNLDDYRPERHLQDFGATIGRFANRIGNGKFSLNGTAYQLPQNNGPHCLHGGPDGWQYKEFAILESSDSHLLMQYLSPDGDNGFPGNIDFRIQFTLSPDNALRIDYQAASDAPTVINVTNHSYFNLNGDPDLSILNHLMQIHSSQFTLNDDTCLPTGEISSVEGTPMDFRTPKAIGRDIELPDQQLINGRGYDHNWILDTKGSLDTPCASLDSPLTHIRMEVYTDQPGMQVYTGNFLDGSVTGKYGKTYQMRHAVCLETQHYPDSPNHPEWAESNTTLLPDTPFHTTTIFKFSQQ